MKKTIMKAIAIILVLSLALPVNVSATANDDVMPIASYYLDAYNTYVCAMGGGRVEVWFEVMGTGIMDEIGVLSIKLYESTDRQNWTRVKTFSYENYDTMLIYNDFWHSDCVSYQGIVGRYYKAYVCIWSGEDGLGDTRYMWTTVERAT